MSVSRLLALVACIVFVLVAAGVSLSVPMIAVGLPFLAAAHAV